MDQAFGDAIGSGVQQGAHATYTVKIQRMSSAVNPLVHIGDGRQFTGEIPGPRKEAIMGMTGAVTHRADPL